MATQKLLVTGGAGYVGSALVPALLAAGHQVRVLDALIYGATGLVTHFENPAFELLPGDIRDRSAVLEAARGADTVVHLAAVVGEPACKVAPKEAAEINGASVATFVQACRAADVRRFVFVSTCSNYGKVPDTELADEDSPLQPLSIYAESKIAAERAVLAASTAGFETIILRFGTISGVAPRMRFDVMLNQWARDVALNTPLEIFAPRAWRAFLVLGDAVDLVKRCVLPEARVLSGGVFNAVSENYRKDGIVEILRRLAPTAKIEVKGSDHDDNDPRSYRVSAAKLEKTLGFRPSRRIEGSISEMYHAVKRGIYPHPLSDIYSSLGGVKPW